MVADPTRTEKTICLAVSPSLKAYGISGRARLFEVVERVKEINASRFEKARRLGVLPKDGNGRPRFRASSFESEDLANDPSLELSYIVAPPRMMLYEKISTQVFAVYSRYISTDDIHVYSIDECFLDVTNYLASYGLTARELAMRMIRDVLEATRITATAGIGTNMYLAKVAMDVVAKHVPADAQGVRIAELDEMSYREKLWCHVPITDFWRVGRGTARRLEKLDCFTMGDVARLSVYDEDRLYKALGINAELLIDHAWGWEPTDIATIRSYRPENRSLTSGQVLKEPYPFDKARLIVREMTELLALDLVRKGVVTKQVTLTVGYDRTSVTEVRRGNAVSWLVTKTGKPYAGRIGTDFYGRVCPVHAHGTGNLARPTSGSAAIVEAMMALFDRIVDPELYVRRVNVVACDIVPEKDVPVQKPEQLDLFTDYEALEREKAEREAAEKRERRLQKATLALQARYGKNALLKGMNFREGAMTIERNGMIGGHRAGPDDPWPAAGAGAAQEEGDRT